MNAEASQTIFRTRDSIVEVVMVFPVEPEAAFYRLVSESLPVSGETLRKPLGPGEYYVLIVGDQGSTVAKNRLE